MKEEIDEPQRNGDTEEWNHGWTRMNTDADFSLTTNGHE